MNRSTSQKIVKVLGILSIIGAILCLILAASMIGVASAGIASDAVLVSDEAAGGVVIVLFTAIIMLVSGILSLIEGIFALRAAKDARKATPLWVISLISVVVSAVSLISSFGDGASAILSGIFTLAIDCVIFYLANNIKKQA